MVQAARDVMENHVVTVDLDDPLDSVRRLFVDEGIHGAPVVDEQRRVVGVISTTDLLRAAYEKLDSERPHSIFTNEGVEKIGFEAEEMATYHFEGPRVLDFMTESVVSVKPAASIAQVAIALREHQIHRVLVMENEVLLGIVSSFDLLGLLGLLEGTAGVAQVA